MAEDHQPTMTLSDTFCDLCPPQKMIICPGFVKEDRNVLGRSLKHYKTMLRTLPKDCQNELTFKYA